VTTVRAQLTADKAILRRDEFEHLLELARRAEPVVVNADRENPEGSLARLAIEGRAFDFWRESDEDIYSPHDGEEL
jgi:hypothetical protein